MAKSEIEKKRDSYRTATVVIDRFRRFVDEFNSEQAAGDVNIGDMIGAAMLAFMHLSKKQQIERIKQATGKAGLAELKRALKLESDES